jgi:phage tail-like protein
VSGLSTATEAIPYREGGYNTTVHQLPGQTTFSPVTLQRGVHLGNDSAWRWMRLLFAVNAAKGPRPGPAKNFRASVRIDVLQHPVKMGEDEGANETLEADGTTNGFAENDPVAVSFKLYNAWITSLAYSDLNAGDNALVVEQMTIVHEGFDMWWNNSLGTSVDGAAMFSV